MNSGTDRLGNPSHSESSGRILFLQVVFALCLAVTVGQLWRLQILHTQGYQSQADANRFRLVTVDARDNLVYAPAGTVALLGVSGLVVVATGDAVLVLPRERAQEVRRVVERLEAEGRSDLL